MPPLGLPPTPPPHVRPMSTPDAEEGLIQNRQGSWLPMILHKSSKDIPIEGTDVAIREVDILGREITLNCRKAMRPDGTTVFQFAEDTGTGESDGYREIVVQQDTRIFVSRNGLNQILFVVVSPGELISEDGTPEKGQFEIIDPYPGEVLVGNGDILKSDKVTSILIAGSHDILHEMGVKEVHVKEVISSSGGDNGHAVEIPSASNPATAVLRVYNPAKVNLLLPHHDLFLYLRTNSLGAKPIRMMKMEDVLRGALWQNKQPIDLFGLTILDVSAVTDPNGEVNQNVYQITTVGGDYLFYLDPNGTERALKVHNGAKVIRSSVRTIIVDSGDNHVKVIYHYRMSGEPKGVSHFVTLDFDTGQEGVGLELLKTSSSETRPRKQWKGKLPRQRPDSGYSTKPKQQFVGSGRPQRSRRR